MRKFLVSLFLLLSGPAFAADASLPFQVGTTIAVSVTTSASSATALPIGKSPSWQIELQNSGSVTAFCNFSGSAVVATTSSYPILTGMDKIVTVDQDSKFVSCITGSGSTSIYVTGGVGQ